MNKKEANKVCIQCDFNNNGWCKEVSSNNFEIKKEKCEIFIRIIQDNKFILNSLYGRITGDTNEKR